MIGVDVVAQPLYPGDEFYQADALQTLDDLIDGGTLNGFRLEDFDGVHASPPCQFASKAQVLRGNEHPNLIVPTRARLCATGLPYVIENVMGARKMLWDPVLLCGTMFELSLYRHRLFECSFPVTAPLHGKHYLAQAKMGRPPGAGQLVNPVGNFSGIAQARLAMEMPWADRAGLREAVPPAYTEFLGRCLTDSHAAVA